MTTSPNVGDSNVGIAGPINLVVDVTPGAGAIAGGPFRAIYVGVTGSPVITSPDGTSHTLANLAAGMWHFVCFTHVTAGGGATDILAGR